MQRVLNFSRENKIVRNSMTSGSVGVTTVWGERSEPQLDHTAWWSSEAAHWLNGEGLGL